MTTTTAPVPAASPTTPATEDKAVRLIKKHPLAIRWMHWINFPVLFIMIWSGVLILWSYQGYPDAKPMRSRCRTASRSTSGASSPFTATPTPMRRTPTTCRFRRTSAMTSIRASGSPKGQGLALDLRLVLYAERRRLRPVPSVFWRVAGTVAAQELVRRGVQGRPARCRAVEKAAAAGQVQPRAAHRLYRA